MHPTNHALLVIDVQNDFCPGGALAVAGGDEIVARINDLMGDFSTVILTQDWHPPGHLSFFTNHEGRDAFSMIDMPYGAQVLWPPHCVQGTPGAEFHRALNTDRAALTIRKGFRAQIDSYSAFFENDHKTPTGLHGYLEDRGIDRLSAVGLATDFCVGDTCVDGAALGYRVTILESACRAIDLDGSLDNARQKMRAAGVTLEP
ncbi:MAG: bifunctional nicotinamidase/pyrazinamidase [Paracoccaceae bacterium]